MLAKSYSIDKSLITVALCISFSILWAIWSQPGTIMIRNGAIIFGTIAAAYMLWGSRQSLDFKKSWLPILMVVLFFLWISVRLFLYPVTFYNS
jgi:hypothetical protein